MVLFREKNYAEKMNKMQRGEMAEFEASFTFSCPKFLSPVPPAYDAVNFDDGLHKEPLKLQLKVRVATKILRRFWGRAADTGSMIL